jgi:large subunit ribosomal protein L13
MPFAACFQWQLLTAYHRRIAVPGTKSFNAQHVELTKNWWIVDGEQQVVGRLATDIAMVLMGKHRPTYTPNIDTGDFVVVTNCDKINFSGSKAESKTYTWYTGYPGLKTETAAKRLKIYRDSEHPHAAQNPQPLTGGRNLK